MTEEQIGARLRAARLQQGISVRGLAQSLGVSPSLISQVETGRTQPSVSTLFSIVSELNVSLDALLSDASPADPRSSQDMRPPTRERIDVPPVQRRVDNPTLRMENGVDWEHLALDPRGSVDMILVTYAPGAASSIEDRLMRHAGHEFAYLIEGELTLRLEFESHVLRAGDSLQFDSTRPHMLTNHTERVARGVWFVVGRRDESLPAASPSTRRSATEVTSAVDALRVFDRFAG